MGGDKRTAAVTALAQEALRDSDLVVEEVSVTTAGRRSVVRIAIDADLSGLPADDETSLVEPLTLDEVAEATRTLSDALDETDALGEAPYVLEVSSPGVGRPLEAPRHYRRNVGRLVELRLVDGSEVSGRLTAAGRGVIRLTQGDVETSRSDGADAREIPIADVRRARVLVDFAATRPEDEED